VFFISTNNNSSFHYFRRLVTVDKIKERVAQKNLSDIPPKTVMEVLAFRPLATKNGQAIILTVILPEHESSRGETQLLVPGRFLEECQEKVPCLMYYDGKKDLDGGKQCHDAKLIRIDDGTVFHDSDDEEGFSIKDFLPICPDCQLQPDLCTGYCQVCQSHQPPDGSQCVCK